jgi:signal peptidase I
VPATGLHPARRALRVLAAVALAAAALAAAALTLPALAGMQRYVITSGSMTGTYDRGTLVFAEVVPVAALREGDVITYRPPPGSGPAGLVTHRIASIQRARGGGRVFRTKGDANAVADPWTFRLDAATQARARSGVPYAGFALAALSQRRVRLAAVALPAALIALWSLAGLWRQLGREAQRRRVEVAA